MGRGQHRIAVTNSGHWTLTETINDVATDQSGLTSISTSTVMTELPTTPAATNSLPAMSNTSVSTSTAVATASTSGTAWPSLQRMQFLT